MNNDVDVNGSFEAEKSSEISIGGFGVINPIHSLKERESAIFHFDITGGSNISNQSASEIEIKNNSPNKKNIWVDAYRLIFHLKKAFQCFSIAIFIAWIYVMIPSANYWVYYLVKTVWISVFAQISFVEIQDIALPDASLATYASSYFFGVFIPPICYIISYYSTFNVGFIKEVNFIGTLPVICVIVCYGIDVFLHPRYGDPSENIILPSDDSRFSSYGDMFLACAPDRSINIKVLNSPELSSSFSAAAERGQSSAAVKSSVVSVIEYFRVTPSTTTTSGAQLGLFFPRNILSSSTEELTPHCVNDRRIQWAYVSTFNIVYNIFFEFLIFFTYDYREQRGSDISVLFKYFVIYVLFCTMFRIILKRIGLAVDSGKRGSISLFFLAEVLGVFYYYSFYRVLFESITTWEVFLLIQLIHILSEWALYPLRASPWFYGVLRRIERDVPILEGSLLGHYLNESDWLHFIALDFGIRVVILVSSGVGIFLLLLTVDFVPWVHIALRQSAPSAVILTSEFIVVAVVLELLNAAAINAVFFAPRKAKVFHKVDHCFSNRRFVFVCTIIAAVLLMDPMFAFLEDGY